MIFEVFHLFGAYSTQIHFAGQIFTIPSTHSSTFQDAHVHFAAKGWPKGDILLNNEVQALGNKIEPNHDGKLYYKCHNNSFKSKKDVSRKSIKIAGLNDYGLKYCIKDCNRTIRDDQLDILFLSEVKIHQLFILNGIFYNKSQSKYWMAIMYNLETYTANEIKITSESDTHIRMQLKDVDIMYIYRELGTVPLKWYLEHIQQYITSKTILFGDFNLNIKINRLPNKTIALFDRLNLDSLNLLDISGECAFHNKNGGHSYIDLVFYKETDSFTIKNAYLIDTLYNSDHKAI
eukprot:NODE_209_length_12852_cov_0.583863.p2 type:complete len:290 gc:universal NODE_209_length_12852_cov_0.583863:2178-3047(+)